MALFPSPQEILKNVQGGSPTSALFDPPTPQSILAKVHEEIPQPSFGATLLKGASSIAKTVTSKVGDFLGYQKETLSQALSPTGDLKVTPADVLAGVKKTTLGIGKGATMIAEGFNEGVGRIIKSASEAALGTATTEKLGTLPGVSEFSKAATGKDRISTYQEINDRARSYALDNNASIDEAKTFAGITVVGALFLDNPAFGPGKKTLLTLSEDAIKNLAKETDEGVIKEILKEEIPSLGERELNVLSPVFRNAANEDEVRATLDQIKKIQQAPLNADAGDDAFPDPTKVLEKSRREIEIPKEEPIATSPTKFFRALEDDANGVRFAESDGQIVHLRDGLETFLRKDGNVYHVVEGSTGRQIGGIAETAQGALESATKALEGVTPEQMTEKLASVKERPPARAAEGARTPQGAGKGAEARAIPEPFSQDLIRMISKEELPGPILERLQTEFPALSRQALSPIAGRLARLRRSGDIQGILGVLRNIGRDIEKSRGVVPENIGSIAKIGKREAVGDLPPSIGELLTDTERGRYLDNVSRSLKNREDAVLAQQEYEALWDHADQRILDRYEELRIYRDILRDQVEVHRGKGLIKYYGPTPPTDATLAELMRRSLGTSNKSAKLDDIVTELGFEDLDDAQKGLQDYLKLRDTLKDIEADIRDIRPKAQVARILQERIEDIPVISREKAGQIESLAAPEDIRTLYKDISGFATQSRDVFRNFETVFGERFPEAKKLILDPLDASKGDISS
ncbi:hypothetical protein KW797_00530, partial [Candidatus Parcubacteria bacterium]|nr:hypothetical protein [Candidatus Parcubacteria bacterium]